MMWWPCIPIEGGLKVSHHQGMLGLIRPKTVKLGRNFYGVSRLKYYWSPGRPWRLRDFTTFQTRL